MFWRRHIMSRAKCTAARLVVTTSSEILTTMPSTHNTITTDKLSPEEEEGLLEELQTYCSPPYSLGRSGKKITKEGLQEIILRWGWSRSPNPKRLKSYDFFLELLRSEQLTEGMLNTVLCCFPEAARFRGRSNKSALHIVILNKVVTLNMVKILVDADPPSVAHEDAGNMTVLHFLCNNIYLGASAKLEILNFLIQKDRGLLNIATAPQNGGALPIHYAAIHKSTPVAFMQKLIDECPEHLLKSLTITGVTPLHIACFNNNLQIVKTLVKANPHCLNAFAGSHFGNPIHAALNGAFGTRRAGHSYLGIFRFLVDFPGSRVSSQQYQGYLPFHLACLAASKVRGDGRGRGWDRLEDAHLEIIKLLFDSFPGAIKHSALVRDMESMTRRGRLLHPKVVEFISHHYTFARPYNVLKKVYNSLPLHSAIMRNESLGSIKLLVKGNPSAVFTPDSNGAIPLHLAVQHHSSPEVIALLIELDRKNPKTTLTIADSRGNTALHYACRGAKFEIVTLLLEKHGDGAVSTSTQNLNGKLPIELLLFESYTDGEERKSTKYTEAVFRLLRANPAVVT